MSSDGNESTPGFLSVSLGNHASLSQSLTLPVRLLATHPLTGQDTLSVARGPIVYTAESIDNQALDTAHPHFAGIGLSQAEAFDEIPMSIENIDMIGLQTKGPAFVLEELDRKDLYHPIGTEQTQRSWTPLKEGLRFVPWFARANRGGAGRVRTAFPRVA